MTKLHEHLVLAGVHRTRTSFNPESMDIRGTLRYGSRGTAWNWGDRRVQADTTIGNQLPTHGSIAWTGGNELFTVGYDSAQH